MSRLAGVPALPIFQRAMLQLERTAIVSRDGPLGRRELTYRDIVASSARIAKEVSPEGDADESRVAFMCPPSEAYVSTLLGSWAAGAVGVPIHVAHPPPEIEHVLRDSQPEVVVFHEQFADVIEPIAAELKLPQLRVTDSDFQPESQPVEVGLTADVMLSDERRALMVYTSGTTGKPKGVVSTHHGLRAMVTDLVDRWEWTADDRIPHFLPLHHTHGILNKLLCPLWSGACVEFVPAHAAGLWRLLAEHATRPASERLTLFMAVPTVYSLMLQALDDAGGGAGGSLALGAEERAAALRGAGMLRMMVSGSAACPVPLMQAWEETTGHRLLERYGMTEIGMGISNPVRPMEHRFPGFVGTPLPGVEARLVRINDLDEDISDDVIFEFDKTAVGLPPLGGTAEVQQAVVVGNDDDDDDDDNLVEGDLQVRGDNVFLEYWRRPDATAEAFTADGWFRTGDVAAFCHRRHAFKICGRASVDIINSGGYMISALDVERVMLAHPRIAEVAVMGIDDADWGERVGAIVVWKKEKGKGPSFSADGSSETGGGSGGDDGTLDGVRKWMDGKIAPYKLPTRAIFLDALPKNAMGKVMKTEIKHYFD